MASDYPTRPVRHMADHPAAATEAGVRPLPAPCRLAAPGRRVSLCEVPEAAVNPAPFLPWVGSKRRLVARVLAQLRPHVHPGSTYIEPFLGSGAVALALPAGTRMVIGDACQPLGYLWWWIKQEPEAIAEYAAGFGVAREEGWNTDDGYIAARYDHNVESFSADDWRPSARFLWLMHACFNGVHRENKLGYFNVPRGDRNRLNIPTPAELRAVADHLVNAEVIVGDFEPMIDAARARDAVYLDPPYDGDKSFVGYIKDGFGINDQARLAEAFWRAVQRGAYVLGSNADTAYIRSLYSDARLSAVDEERSVAANAESRMPAPCVFIESGGRG